MAIRLFWSNSTDLRRSFDCLCGVAATAFEQSEQVIDLAVIRREIARFAESLGGGVVVSLAQCEQSPVGPTGRLGWSELRELLELCVGLDVVTDLQRGESDVERADELVVLRRRSVGRLFVGRQELSRASSSNCRV